MSEKQSDFLLSNYPVLFPSHDAFSASESQFQTFLKQSLAALGSTSSSATILQHGLDDLAVKNAAPRDNEEIEEELSKQNKMLTENTDVAHRSTTNPLVDLFAELEEVITGARLRSLLAAAWEEDPVVTLKIIFNARSIHIGKSSRSTFYRCAGWLAEHHPLTLLVNLHWLARPVINKKPVNKKEGSAKDAEDEEAPVLVEAEKDEDDASRFDVKYGVAHGYYKDLLNILVLAVNDNLDVLKDPRDTLNVANKLDKRKKRPSAQEARAKRHDQRDVRHRTAVAKFNSSAFYKALHTTVARIFAAELSKDLALLSSADSKKMGQISLCAKWAPSRKLFHDKHTFIVSSIAEILHPQTSFKEIQDRETYLRHAREAYRKDVASLRKVLDIVERKISANAFSEIKYEKVPSLAMNRYSAMFARKDTERFEQYITNVAQGKQNISGAVLLPSTIIHDARAGSHAFVKPLAKHKTVAAMTQEKLEAIRSKTVDGQWKTLVQRIRDSGTLSSAIAVCDVSGSMNSPIFSDKTVPMDSAIGFSLLIAEVAKPPFGGQFITFSSTPCLEKIDLKATLHEKIRGMEASNWNMSTDFVAVFEKLLLPQVKSHKIKAEDMIKTVFVFSDMQFDQAADTYHDRWSTSFERVKKEFELAGYEMPQLVFWNLAGGRAGCMNLRGDASSVAPKPVTADEAGTALVSGYSQGLLKTFLENGEFEEPEEAVEEEIREVEISSEDDVEQVVIEKRKKIKMDPLITVKKAISHKAYAMLVVAD